MPLYNYVCKQCAITRCAGNQVTGLTDAELVESAVFETAHSMHPTPEELLLARECPRCGSIDTAKTYHGTDIICYVRGNGYLDKHGTRRDMALHTLRHDDPYAEYRVPGEVDELAKNLKRGDSPRPKHFDMGPA